MLSWIISGAVLVYLINGIYRCSTVELPDAVDFDEEARRLELEPEH